MWPISFGNFLISYCSLSISKYFELKTILYKYKLLEGDSRRSEKRGEFFWLSGITIQLIYNIILMKNLFNKEKKLIPKIEDLSVKQFFKKLDNYNFLWRQYSLNMIKIWMEMIICWENLGIDKKILRTKIGDPLLAFAGITSSLIAIFQGY